ncbi:MAG: hypothetical protein HOP08_12235 [Cyclobacteriaceae bacterium]|nr:hypothetical protein [Cyclobacteriaceae bacterium]
MDAINSGEKTAVLHQIILNLLDVPQELELLGKELGSQPEKVQEKFRILNLEFLHHVLELKKAVSAMPGIEAIELQPLFQQLEALLLTAVDNNLQLTSHKTNITSCLLSIEQKLSEQFLSLIQTKVFSHEMEKYKLKLEILRLRFLVRDYQFRKAYHSGMKRAGELTHHLIRDVNRIVTTNPFNDASIERKIKRIYRHMKDAVQQS